MNNLIKLPEEILDFNKLIKDLKRGSTNLFAYGVSDSQRAFLISSLYNVMKSQVLVVAADSLEAKKISEDLAFFLGKERVVMFPTSSVIPYETAAKSLESIAQRLKVMELLILKNRL